MLPVLPIYFENAVGRLLEHPDGYAYFQYYPGKRKLSDLQALLTHTSRLLQRNKWCKILGDQRLMLPFTDEESAWIVEHWLAHDRQRPGGIYAAVILANDVFARLATSQIQYETKASALTYRVFEHEAAAAVWLLQAG